MQDTGVSDTNIFAAIFLEFSLILKSFFKIWGKKTSFPIRFDTFYLKFYLFSPENNLFFLIYRKTSNKIHMIFQENIQPCLRDC